MPSVFLDGDYQDPQIAAPPVYEVPFKTDPRRYAYKVTYWQFDVAYANGAFNDAGPFGGTFVSEEGLKSIGGGVLEFQREFAIVPGTRNEFESFTYSYQFVTTGESSSSVTEVPIIVQSRVQFDYFKSDSPGGIDLPKCPKAIQVGNTVVLADGFGTLTAGQEILAQDATMKCWKGNIYERIQRFIVIDYFWNLIGN